MRGFGPNVVSVVGPIRVKLLVFFCCGIQWFVFVLPVPCICVVICWEKADLLALLCVMFSCVFVTFPYGVLGQVWYLIVSILSIHS